MGFAAFVLYPLSSLEALVGYNYGGKFFGGLVFSFLFHSDYR